MADRQPRPSASVILVRDHPSGGGLETFMVQRHAMSPSFPSVFVFPGGTVREDDTTLAIAERRPLGEALSTRSDRPIPTDEAAALYVCALRELFEEAGVLLVRDGAGNLLEVEPAETTLQERLESTRLALQARELSIGQVLADHGWQPAFDRLIPYSHWITPASAPTRFDTRFFVAELPRGQTALHDTIETSEGLWMTPPQALEPTYQTMYPTVQHLKRLATFGSVRELLDFARGKPIRMVSPDMTRDEAGAMQITMRPDLVDRW